MKKTRDIYAMHYRWRQPKYYPTKSELLSATGCKSINEICEKYNVSKATCNRFIKHGLFEENIWKKFDAMVVTKLDSYWRVQNGR